METVLDQNLHGAVGLSSIAPQSTVVRKRRACRENGSQGLLDYTDVKSVVFGGLAS